MEILTEMKITGTTERTITGKITFQKVVVVNYEAMDSAADVMEKEQKARQEVKNLVKEAVIDTALEALVENLGEKGIIVRPSISRGILIVPTGAPEIREGQIDIERMIGLQNTRPISIRKEVKESDTEKDVPSIFGVKRTDSTSDERRD